MSRALILGSSVTALVVALTAIFLFTRSEPASNSTTWIGRSGLFSFETPSVLPTSQQSALPGSGVDSLGIVPLPQVSEEESTSFAADLIDLLTQLTAPSTREEDTDPEIPSGYSFIPQGLIGVSTPPQLTPAQEELREYGNAVGSLLASFATLHTTMLQVLKDHGEDRDDPQKKAALRRLGEDFVRLGDDVASIDTPPSASQAHTALVAAYRDAGGKLAAVADTTNDQAFIDAIFTYNTSAETLSQRLVGFVDLFSAQGITFSSSDPGSIFTFSAGSSY